MILNSLGLIPVNRAVDTKISGVSNEDSFSKCYELLEKGKSLVIFPEGNSFQERMLRKLKSGTARIALETEKRNDGKLGLLIVPVGLIYLEASKFRSAVVANVGEPISPLTYLEMFKSDSLKAARKLTEEFKNGLSQLLINSDSKEQETLADQVIELLASPYKRGSSNEVEDEIDEMKTVYNRLNQLYSTDIQLIERVKKLVWLINWQTEKLEINAKFLDKPSPKLRKENRIKTIHSSLSIEGNTLTEEQIMIQKAARDFEGGLASVQKDKKYGFIYKSEE